MDKQEKTLNKVKAAVYKNFGILGSREDFSHGFQAVKYTDIEPEIFWSLLSFLRGKKGLEIEENYYCYSIRVFEAEANKEAKERGKAQEKLVEGFWETMHAHGREAADNYYKKHIEEYKYFGMA